MMLDALPYMSRPRAAKSGKFSMVFVESEALFVVVRWDPGAAENGAEDVLGFLNTAMKDLATHAFSHACP